MCKKFLFILSFLTSSFFSLNAQTINEIQVGLSIPQGDFGDDSEVRGIYNGSGVARTGIYFGYKMLSPLRTEGLYWTLNAGIMYNDLQRDYKDLFEDLIEDADQYWLPKYFNIPILGGLHYEKSISDGFNLYADAGVGINILQLSNFYKSVDDFEQKNIFKPSVQLGYKIGAGVVLKEKYTISINYLGLGSHKVRYKSKFEYDGTSESENDKFERALSVSSLNITFGYRLQ
jgi:hypothetical protein